MVSKVSDVILRNYVNVFKNLPSLRVKTLLILNSAFKIRNES